MGRCEEAEEHFRHAFSMSERMRAPVWLAHAQFEYGRMLLEDPDRAGDARGLLLAALDTTRRVGMRGLQSRIEDLVGPAATAAVTSVPTIEPLSDRETEVLRLIAQGKSNREIAQALVISVNTAANHVKNILGKTGATNRTEAASYAFRLGLMTKPR
jgi:DNA-binding CsgD family transcriptional regulator